MDVFWFRIPKTAPPDNETMGVFDTGTLFVMIDRGDYYQCAFVFAKGGAESDSGPKGWTRSATESARSVPRPRRSIRAWRAGTT